jgi:hypothetical protein
VFVKGMENTAAISELTYGSSKYRREQIKIGIDELKSSLQLPPSVADSLSQLQTLHFASKYFLKNKNIKHLFNSHKLGKSLNERIKKTCRNI